MGEERDTTTVRVGAGMPLAAATGIAALGGLIPLMAVAGEWWLMAAVLATLVLVVLMIMRVLDQSGDAVAAVPEPSPAAVPARGRTHWSCASPDRIAVPEGIARAAGEPTACGRAHRRMRPGPDPAGAV